MCPACWTALLITVGKVVGGTAAGAGLLVAAKKLKNKLMGKSPEAKPAETATCPTSGKTGCGCSKAEAAAPDTLVPLTVLKPTDSPKD
jgi:hypothetical protein